LLSFGIIGVLAFLLLVSLAISAIITGLSESIKNLLPGVGPIVLFIINTVITLGITTVLFAVIFKVLPDANIKWKDVWPGAIATSILFLIGKFAISFYIGKSEVGSTYGTAGSMIILLLWIYYSSMILYFGAEFTRAYDVKFGSEIRPNKHAMIAHMVPVEGEHESLQELEQDKEEGTLGEAPKANKEKETPKPKKAPLPARKAEPSTLVYEPVQQKQPKGSKERSPDGLYRIRVEKKKETGIGVALAGLALFFVNTALDQSRQSKA
jgi:membrane protein